MSEKVISFVFTQAPYGNASGREGLDAVLASSAFTESIEVYFVQDGVFQLLKHQQSHKICAKDHASGFKLMDLYDIEQVFVCEKSMQSRGITPEMLLIDAEILSTEVLQTRLSETAVTLTY